jgi:hypothetical protein
MIFNLSNIIEDIVISLSKILKLDINSLFGNIIAILIYLFLGGILTIAGTFLTQCINRIIRRKLFKEKLLNEFKFILPRLICSYHNLNSSLGILNIEKIKWTYSMVTKYPESLSEDLFEKVKELVNKSDEEIKKFSKSVKDANQTGKSINKYILPVLQSNDIKIVSFSSNFQNDLLAIERDLNWINEIIDWATFYFRKTFDSSMTERNRQIINSNEDKSYKDIADLLKRTADNIVKMLEKYFNHEIIK